MVMHKLSFQFRVRNTPKTPVPNHPAAELLPVQSTVGTTYLTPENQALASKLPSSHCSVPELSVYAASLWRPVL